MGKSKKQAMNRNRTLKSGQLKPLKGVNKM